MSLRHHYDRELGVVFPEPLIDEVDKIKQDISLSDMRSIANNFKDYSTDIAKDLGVPTRQVHLIRNLLTNSRWREQ